jgi:hypothetical protein
MPRERREIFKGHFWRRQILEGLNICRHHANSFSRNGILPPRSYKIPQTLLTLKERATWAAKSGKGFYLTSPARIQLRMVSTGAFYSMLPRHNILGK